MKDIHECAKRLEVARRRLSSMEHGDLLLKFFDHLKAHSWEPVTEENFKFPLLGFLLCIL